MKRFGIRITLPPGSTLAAPHLLGPDWEAFRWYASEAERERAFAAIARDLPNYRVGDHPAQRLERVERDD
jgi:hypothetical protein